MHRPPLGTVAAGAVAVWLARRKSFLTPFLSFGAAVGFRFLTDRRRLHRARTFRYCRGRCRGSLPSAEGFLTPFLSFVVALGYIASPHKLYMLCTDRRGPHITQTILSQPW